MADMGKRGHITDGRIVVALSLALLLPAVSHAGAQTVVTNPPPTPPPTAATAPQGVLVDQVIAVVNDDLILESDVDEERRFEAFQPLRGLGGFSRAKAIERLVDRALILQQARLQPDIAVSDDEVDAQLQALRKDIPACKQYRCGTDAGWARFVQDQGFTIPQLRERWRQRMQILKFIEIRFKAGIRITSDEIKTYYTQTLVPEYTKQHETAPRLDTISDRISEILLQERVTSLLDDWLQTLKAQGAVRMMKPGEVPA